MPETRRVRLSQQRAKEIKWAPEPTEAKTESDQLQAIIERARKVARKEQVKDQSELVFDVTEQKDPPEMASSISEFVFDVKEQKEPPEMASNSSEFVFDVKEKKDPPPEVTSNEFVFTEPAKEPVELEEPAELAEPMPTDFVFPSVTAADPKSPAVDEPKKDGLSKTPPKPEHSTDVFSGGFDFGDMLTPDPPLIDTDHPETPAKLNDEFAELKHATVSDRLKAVLPGREDNPEDGQSLRASSYDDDEDDKSNEEYPLKDPRSLALIRAADTVSEDVHLALHQMEHMDDPDGPVIYEEFVQGVRHHMKKINEIVFQDHSPKAYRARLEARRQRIYRRCIAALSIGVGVVAWWIGTDQLASVAEDLAGACASLL